MSEIDYELSRFFAWARERAYIELDKRMKNDPALDPNWAFSDIMQELLTEYKALNNNSDSIGVKSDANTKEKF